MQIEKSKEPRSNTYEIKDQDSKDHLKTDRAMISNNLYP